MPITKSDEDLSHDNGGHDNARAAVSPAVLDARTLASILCYPNLTLTERPNVSRRFQPNKFSRHGACTRSRSAANAVPTQVSSSWAPPARASPRSLASRTRSSGTRFDSRPLPRWVLPGHGWLVLVAELAVLPWLPLGQRARWLWLATCRSPTCRSWHGAGWSAGNGQRTVADSQRCEVECHYVADDLHGRIRAEELRAQR